MSFNHAHASTVQIAAPGWTAPKGEEPLEAFGLVFDTGSDGCVIEGTAAELIAMASSLIHQLSFDASQEDWWVCPCGNDPHGAGLYPCDAHGNAMEPLAGSGWDGHYYCSSCGRYGSQKDRTPGGLVPVLGYASHFTGKAHVQPGPESWGGDPDHPHASELADD